jgi:hypothetical protein
MMDANSQEPSTSTTQYIQEGSTFESPITAGPGATVYVGNVTQFINNEDPAQPCKPFSIIPYQQDPNFVDRSNITMWMREKFARPGGRAALVGLGGTG